MTRAFVGIGVVLVALAAIGCDAPKKKPTAVKNNVLDVSPAAAPVASKPVATPLVQERTGLPPSDSITYTTTPGTYASVGPSAKKTAATRAPAAAPAVATAGGQYKVKPGDTLFGIARNSYGSGNQWNRIASANPGLSPSTLKVGQTITIP
jgi:nucleoid-associated protein YgaU